MFKTIALSVIGIIVLVFALELIGLGFFKFFEPKRENIRREVYENTQSFVEGKLQDLAKYYGEYQKASAEDKEIIKTVIQSQFSYFDADKVTNPKLQSFLINMRGF